MNRVKHGGISANMVVAPESKIQMLGLRVDDEGERERIPVKLEMDC